MRPDCRLIWGIVPDFWSISGSGLILGGAIWVAVAKSRIKHGQDDLERNEYVALNRDEQNVKDNEFQLGEVDDEEDEHMASSSGSTHCESRESREEMVSEIK